MEEWIKKIEGLLPQVQEYIHSLEIENRAYAEKIKDLNYKLQQTEQEREVYKRKYEAIKITQALLGSDEKRTEIKLKINSLIREIDQCILQLSESHHTKTV